MRLHLALGCCVWVACAPTAPKSITVDTKYPGSEYSRHRPPFEGPFETDPREAERIYEAVLAHNSEWLAKVERNRGTNGKSDSATVRLDVRIGRYYPPGLVTTGEHDTTWVRSVIGRMRIVGRCPNGLRRTCQGIALVLSPIRRPDSTTAEVELASYWSGPPRRGGSGSELLVLRRDDGVWRVARTEARWVS